MAVVECRKEEEKEPEVAYREHGSPVGEGPHGMGTTKLEGSRSFTLEGLGQSSSRSLLELPDLDEATVRVISHGDQLVQMGKHRMRIHVVTCNTDYTLHVADGEPDLSTLVDTSITFKSY